MDVGVVGGGGGRFVHQRDSFAQGSQLGRSDRKIAAAEGVGAAEIDACQLVVRPGGEHFLEGRDALCDGGTIPAQGARVERADHGIVRQSEGAGKEKKGAKDREPGPSHLKQWTKRAGKTNLGSGPPGRRPMLFRNKLRHPSRNIIAYTTHKAGSMVLHRVLKDICELNRIRYYSPNENKSQLPFKRMFAGEDFIAKKRGCFGPIRFFVPTKALDKASIILHLRDPRDVLASMFFSYCYMHAGEIEAHTGYRKEVAEAGIDRFVLDMVGAPFYDYRGDYGIGSRYKKHVGTVLDRYQRYLDELLGRPNTTAVSYEEMVLAFPSWLEKIVGAFDLKDPEETRAVVAARHANSVAAGKGRRLVAQTQSHARRPPGKTKIGNDPATRSDLRPGAGAARLFRVFLREGGNPSSASLGAT